MIFVSLNAVNRLKCSQNKQRAILGLDHRKIMSILSSRSEKYTKLVLNVAFKQSLQNSYETTSDRFIYSAAFEISFCTISFAD